MWSLHLLVLLSTYIQAFAFDLTPDVTSPSFASGQWSLSQEGYVLAECWTTRRRADRTFCPHSTSGVSGMQLAIVSETTAIIFDKVYVHGFLER